MYPYLIRDRFMLTVEYAMVMLKVSLNVLLVTQTTLAKKMHQLPPDHAVPPAK